MPKPEEKKEKELKELDLSVIERESIAGVQHDIWSHWMKHLFNQGTFNRDGSWTMPKEKSEQCQRQMNTPYQDLTEKEKESDRDQADKVLAILERLP